MSQTFKLRNGDNAIIIRENGDEELHLSKKTCRGSNIITILGMALRNEETLKYLEDKLEDAVADYNNVSH